MDPEPTPPSRFLPLTILVILLIAGTYGVKTFTYLGNARSQAAAAAASSGLQSVFLGTDPDAQAVARGEKALPLPAKDTLARDFSWKLLNAYRMLGYESSGMPYGKMIDVNSIKDLDAQVAAMEKTIAAKAAELPFYDANSKNTFINNLPANFGAYVIASIWDLENAGTPKYQTYTPECLWAGLYPTIKSNLLGGGTGGLPSVKGTTGAAKTPFIIQQSILYGFSTNRLIGPNGGEIGADQTSDAPVASTLTYVDGFIHELTHDMDSIFDNGTYVQEVYSRTSSCTGSVMDFKRNDSTSPFAWQYYSYGDCHVDNGGALPPGQSSATGPHCANYVSEYASTNSLEDAAESVDAYIVAPDYFRSRAQGSATLKKKYDYIKNTLFGGVEFDDPALSSSTLNFYAGSDLTGIFNSAIATGQITKFVVSDIRKLSPYPGLSATLQTNSSTYQGGQPVVVSWNAQGPRNAKDWVGIVMQSGSWTSYPGSRAQMWKYTGGTATGTTTLIAPNMSGDYQIVYFANDGFTEIARGPKFSITAVQLVQKDKSTYTTGDTMQVSWNISSLGDTKDWIGLVKAGGLWTDYTAPRSQMWFYTAGALSGSKTMIAPLPGSYQLVYFLKDGYMESYRSDAFTISPPSPGASSTAPTIFVNASSYTQGGSNIVGSWNNPAGATATDWVGVVPANGTWQGSSASYTNWVWANSSTQTQGGSGATQGPITFAPAMPAGQYQLVYFLNQKDGSGNYIEKARSGVFTITASAQGTLSISFDQPQYQSGGTITVAFSNPGTIKAKNWIGIVSAGGAWGSAPSLGEGKTWAWAGMSNSGSKILVAPTAAGTYQIVYFSSDDGTVSGSTELMRSSSFTVASITPSPPLSISITTTAASYIQAGPDITGSWTNPIGAAATDWIGLVPSGFGWTGNSTTYANWLWATSNSKTQGTSGATQGPITIPTGMPAGQYQLVYFVNQKDANGNYIEKARSPIFTVSSHP